MRRLAWLSVALALLAAGPAAAEPVFARFRLLQAAPGLGPVNVYVDGTQTRAKLAYGQLSEWVKTAPGTHNFKAVAVGESRFVDDRDAALTAGQDCTIALVPVVGQIGFLRLPDRTPTGADGGHVRAVHLLAGGPPVTLLPKGDPAVGTLAFGQVLRPVAASEGDHRWVLRAGADRRVVAEVGPLTIARRTTLTLFLLGQWDGRGDLAPRVVEDVQSWPSAQAYEPDQANPAPPAKPSPPPPPTRLRLLHLAPGTPPVALRLDQQTVWPQVKYGVPVDYESVSAGHHVVELGPAKAPLGKLDIELEAGQPYTLVLYDPPGHTRLQLLRDRPAEGPATRLRLLHTVEAVGDLEFGVAGQPALVGRLAYPAYSDYVDLPAGAPARLRLRRVGQDTVLKALDVVFDGGANYTVYVAGSLSQALADYGLTLIVLKDGSG